MSSHIAKYWNDEKLQNLYINLIGKDYGSNPLEKISEIEADKEKVANIIINDCNIDSSKIGMEIGVGIGHVIKTISKVAKSVYACDISSCYLEVAKKYCSGIDNISFHLIDSCKLDLSLKEKIDFVYSNNVFIHLTFYEILTYLKEIKKILKPGGYLWFDFMEIERVDVLNNPDLEQTLIALEVDPHERRCLQFNSAIAIQKAMLALDFAIIKQYQNDRCTTMLLAKLN